MRYRVDVHHDDDVQRDIHVDADGEEAAMRKAAEAAGWPAVECSFRVWLEV